MNGLIPVLRFTYDDAERVAEEWGCNCGPSALAAALSLTLDEVRPLINGFDQRGYMSPIMMKEALNRSGVQWREKTKCRQVPRSALPAAFPTGLCRVQWTGPWTAAGANPRWAYNHTHWIATWQTEQGVLVFDINRGLTTYEDWEEVVPPLITSGIKRADGGWYATHLWEIQQCE